MDLRKTRVENADVVGVTGEVDVSSVGLLEEFVADLGAAELVLDLTGVTFMDTTGVRFLLGQASRLAEDDRTMRLVLKEQSPVLLMLKITGLSDQFTITEPDESSGNESS